MNITTGAVNVVSGDATITGVGVGTAWSAASANDIIVVNNISYLIVSITVGTTSMMEVTPTPAETLTGVSYTLIIDFTPSYNLPMMYKGDVGTAATFSRAMQQIDSAIAAVAAVTSNTANALTYMITSAAHGFVAGDIVRYDGAAWQKATADSLINCACIGMVTTATTNTFTVTMGGLVTISSAPWTPGALYILSNTGTLINANTATYITDYVVFRPVVHAITAAIGVLQNMAVGMPGAYTDLYPGLVPPYTLGDTTSILSVTGWVSPPSAVISARAVQAMHLAYDASAIDLTAWTSYWASFIGGSSTQGSMDALLTLKTAVDTWAHNKIDARRIVYAGIVPNAYDTTWTVPAGTTQVRIRMWGAGGYQSGYTGAYQGGAYVEILLDVTAGDTFDIRLGYYGQTSYVFKGASYILSIEAGYASGIINTTGGIVYSGTTLVNEMSSFITTATPVTGVPKTAIIVIERINRTAAV